MKRTGIRGHSTTHRETLSRLARVEGQIRGVQRMVEEGAYCVDILTQIQAAQAALRSVSRRILIRHLETCVLQTSSDGEPDDKQNKFGEISDLLRRGL